MQFVVFINVIYTSGDNVLELSLRRRIMSETRIELLTSLVITKAQSMHLNTSCPYNIILVHLEQFCQFRNMWKFIKTSRASSFQKIIENHRNFQITYVYLEYSLPISGMKIKDTHYRNISNSFFLTQKARLAANGYSQVEEVDYEDAFAPTVRYPSI